MNTLVPVSENSVDIVSMSFNNLPNKQQQPLQSNTNQTNTSAAANLFQQNHPFGLAMSQPQPSPQPQQLQGINLQQLQAQINAQEQALQQAQSQSQYTPQQIAAARQALMFRRQQMAYLVQQQQQQQQQGPQPMSVVGSSSAMNATVSTDIGKSAVNTDTNGIAKAQQGIVDSATTSAPSASGNSNNMAALRAIAAKFGIPDDAMARLTPPQLQMFLHSLQMQQQQQHQNQPVSVSTPQRPQPATLITQQQQQQQQQRTFDNGTPTPNKVAMLPNSTRSGKSTSRVNASGNNSERQSPAPQNISLGGSASIPHLFTPTAVHAQAPHQSQTLGSPTSGMVNSPRSLHTPTIPPRKGSATPMFGDDMRDTPTPSETSISNLPSAVIYSPEEIANAHRISEEFLKILPTFTSESFVVFLQGFLKENNIQGNFSKPPVFGEQHIDLYKFFTEVVRQGGLEQVHKRKIWRQVAQDSGLPNISTLPPLLSRWYKVWLQPLEQIKVFPPGHPKHTGVGANFSAKKKKRKQKQQGDGGSLTSPQGTPGPGERSFSANLEHGNSKRQRMYSPIANGIATAHVSPGSHFTSPPPPLSLSGSGGLMQSPMNHSLSANGAIGSLGATASSASMVTAGPPTAPTDTVMSSTPSLPTNGPTAPAFRAAQSMHDIGSDKSKVASPALPQPNGVASPQIQPTNTAAAAADVQEETETEAAISVVTIPPVQQPVPQQMQFFPLERTLDTYGGVDLQTCVAFRPRAFFPSIGDYGAIDIRALTLSIESGITLEVTAALNTLVRITAHPDVILPLSQCEELAETLMDIVASMKLPAGGAAIETTNALTTYSEDARLLSRLYGSDLSEGGMVGDDMQDESAVRGLLNGGDDLWSFTSDRTLSVVYALRNLTFLPANQPYLGNNLEFISMFVKLTEQCDQAVGVAQQIQEGDKMKGMVVLRSLEYRKSLMTMLANISGQIDLSRAGEQFLQTVFRLFGYFADDSQTSDITEEWMRESTEGVDVSFSRVLDGRAYYLHVLDAAGRLSLADANRQYMVSTISMDVLQQLTRACAELLAGHQAAMAWTPNAQINFSETRLMWVQMSLMVVSNLVSATTSQVFLATRKYTTFRISAGGAITGENGGDHRGMARRPTPFKSATYAVEPVPQHLKDFRQEVVDQPDVVRSLFELVLVWWRQIGAVHMQNGGQPVDSVMNDVAERAVYVLQLLHAGHDEVFAERWQEWMVDKVAGAQCPRALAEVLYELVGVLPVYTITLTRKI